MWTCDLCGKTFDRKWNYNRHIANNKKYKCNGANFSCDLCGQTFRYAKFYKRHINKKQKCIPTNHAQLTKKIVSLAPQKFKPKKKDVENTGKIEKPKSPKIGKKTVPVAEMPEPEKAPEKPRVKTPEKAPEKPHAKAPEKPHAKAPEKRPQPTEISNCVTIPDRIATPQTFISVMKSLVSHKDCHTPQFDSSVCNFLHAISNPLLYPLTVRYMENYMPKTLKSIEMQTFILQKMDTFYQQEKQKDSKSNVCIELSNLNLKKLVEKKMNDYGEMLLKKERKRKVV